MFDPGARIESRREAVTHAGLFRRRSEVEYGSDAEGKVNDKLDRDVSGAKTRASQAGVPFEQISLRLLFAEDDGREADVDEKSKQPPAEHQPSKNKVQRSNRGELDGALRLVVLRVEEVEVDEEHEPEGDVDGVESPCGLYVRRS